MLPALPVSARIDKHGTYKRVSVGQGRGANQPPETTGIIPFTHKISSPIPTPAPTHPPIPKSEMCHLEGTPLCFPEALPASPEFPEAVSPAVNPPRDAPPPGSQTPLWAVRPSSPQQTSPGPSFLISKAFSYKDFPPPAQSRCSMDVIQTKTGTWYLGPSWIKKMHVGTVQRVVSHPHPQRQAPPSPGSHLTARMCIGWERGVCRDLVPEGGGWLRECWPFWSRGAVSDCMLQDGYKLSSDAFTSFTRASRSTSSSGRTGQPQENRQSRMLAVFGQV